MDSGSSKKSNPLYSNNYKTTDFVWAASLGEGESQALIFLNQIYSTDLYIKMHLILRMLTLAKINTNKDMKYRCLRKCEIRLAER